MMINKMLQRSLAPMVRVSLFLAIVLIVNSYGAAAQQLPPGTLEVKALYLPSSNYIQTLDSLQDPGSSQHVRFSLGYSFMVHSKMDTVTKKFSSWSGYVNSNYSSFNHKDNKSRLIPDRLLFSEVGLIHYKSMRNRWAAIQTLSVGLNSDLEHVSMHDVFVNAGLIYLKRYNDNFSLGFGVFAYNALSTPMVLPGLVVQWQTAGNYRLLINLPNEISVAHTMPHDVELKLAFRPKNINYDVHNPLVKDRRSLSYWELPIGLELKKKTTRMQYGIEAGLMALRSFQFNERGLSNMFKSTPGHMLSAGAFVSGTVQYRLKP